MGLQFLLQMYTLLFGFYKFPQNSCLVALAFTQYPLYPLPGPCVSFCTRLLWVVWDRDAILRHGFWPISTFWEVGGGGTCRDKLPLPPVENRPSLGVTRTIFPSYVTLGRVSFLLGWGWRGKEQGRGLSRLGFKSALAYPSQMPSITPSKGWQWSVSWEK